MRRLISNHRLLYLHIARCLGLGAAHSRVSAEVPQAATLATGSLALFLGLVRLATEVNTLAPLPGLDAKEEQNGLDEHNAPLPGDSRVLEHTVVDDGDIQNREREDETGHDTPEQEAVAPDVEHPLGEVALRVGLHAEETSAQIDHLPG